MMQIPRLVVRTSKRRLQTTSTRWPVLAFRWEDMSDRCESNDNYVKVLLADDAAVIRSAVSRLLESEPTIKLVGVAETFSETIEMVATLRPDVVLLDLHMPDERTLEPEYIKAQLRPPGSNVRIIGMSLSGNDDEEVRNLGDSLGALTVLEKSRFYSELIPTILGRI
jgi:DNA-binding NarL/FixJ family response regulator